MDIEEKFTRKEMLEKELTRLLNQPFRARQGAFRQGDFVGLTVTPGQRQEQTLVDLTVYIFPMCAPPGDGDEQTSETVAFKAFGSELEDSDYHIRMAACQALGQLGNRRARPLLEEKVQHDNNDFVRTAARKALAMLETQRFGKQELAHLPLVISQEVDGIWEELALEVTDREGVARFKTVSAAADCRLALQPDGFPDSTLQALKMYLPAMYSEAGFADTGDTTLAAHKGSKEDAQEALPQSREIQLPDGYLVLVVYQNEQNEVILTFRSLAPSLRGKPFFFIAIDRQTNLAEFIQEVELRLEDDQAPDEESVPTASFNLTQLLDMKKTYALEVKLPEPE